jgi:hypothetical protein
MILVRTFVRILGEIDDEVKCGADQFHSLSCFERKYGQEEDSHAKAQRRRENF